MNCPRCHKPMQNLGNVSGVVLASYPPQCDETHACHGCKVKCLRRVVVPPRVLGTSALDTYETVPAAEVTVCEPVAKVASWEPTTRTLRTTLAAWLEHGPTWVRDFDVRRVELTDKKPLATVPPGSWGYPTGWWSFAFTEDDRVPEEDEEGTLPGFLKGTLSGPTEQAALDALSAACIAWAKEQPEP